MSDESLEILPSTKVAQLLDAYPELEQVLIRMAPPFKKLKNPILRKSVARVATLKQAAIAGRLDLSSMVNQLREVIGQAALPAGLIRVAWPVRLMIVRVTPRRWRSTGYSKPSGIWTRARSSS